MHNRYLEILELQPGASKKDIKSAYRRLSKQYHPDINRNEDAKEEFIKINEAYKFLMEVGPKPQQQQTAYDYDPMAGEYARWRARARQYAWEKAREAAQQRNELIQQILSRFNYVAAIIVIFNVLLGIDYLLPMKAHEQKILNVKRIFEKGSAVRSGKYKYDELYLEHYTMQLEDGAINLSEYSGESIVLATPIFNKPMAIKIAINETTVATYFQMYNIFIVFGFLIPLVIFLYLLYHFGLRTPDGRLTLATFISFFFLVQLFLFFRF